MNMKIFFLDKQKTRKSGFFYAGTYEGHRMLLALNNMCHTYLLKGLWPFAPALKMVARTAGDEQSKELWTPRAP
jgi:hypothetical protein